VGARCWALLLWVGGGGCSRPRPPASGGRPSWYGLLPASISHEGYSARPMHSYWDDFWAIAGYDSGIRAARSLGRFRDAARLEASRREFRTDLLASIAATTDYHGIDYVPGCAELGDFDPTSTASALAPTGAADFLPATLLQRTFEEYWLRFVARRAGDLEGPAYTPYEVRLIGAFVRLGWPERARELLRYFMDDRRPAPWNQWAEVVGHDARAPRFIGDMPHGWVASDFIRSALDLFAYERSADRALVLAAGVDPAWLAGPGIEVDGLRTPWGPLSYALQRVDDGQLRLRVAGGIDPPGGLVLAVGGAERALGRAPLDVTFEVPLDH
jgi:hypothetical protein